MKYNLCFCDDIFGINDSMEVESGTELARLESGEHVVTLEVRGDVRVRYKDEIYETQCQFPEELLQLFHNGQADQEHGVEVIDNNWLEVFLWIRKGKKLEWTGESDVVDAGFDTVTDVFTFLKDCLDIYLGNIKASHVEISILDWYGAGIPYREVNLSHDDGSEPVLIKVTKNSLINSGLIIEGSPLDDVFAFYVEDDIFEKASYDELEGYVSALYENQEDNI